VPASDAAPSRRTIRGYPLTRAIARILCDGRTLPRAVDLARAVITEFFAPQFETRLFPGLRPVVRLGHPLDRRLPFRPGRLGFYLGYMGIVLKTVGFVGETCGSSARRDAAAMLRELCRLYAVASTVYRRCQSTTLQRLPLRPDPRTLLVRLFDPHLHCVPSLHVLAMCYNYWRAGQLLQRGLPAGHPALERSGELFDLAVEMTETVLMVRQHSVMDIGPTLYLLSRTFPGYGEQEVRRFSAALFAGQPALARAVRAQVRRGYQELKKASPRASAAGAAERIVEYLLRHDLLADQSLPAAGRLPAEASLPAQARLPRG
jgi:hypothetical protein